MKADRHSPSLQETVTRQKRVKERRERDGVWSVFAGLPTWFGLVVLSFGLTACGIFGGDDKTKMENPSTTLGVNGYLWQATLDTLDFMPIDNADPAAAVILTDWYSADGSPDERIRIAVRFLSEQLRSDGIRVSVIRQEKRDQDWVSAPVQATTVLKVEEAILTQARRLFVSRES